jgi:hypothetical protein
MVPQRQRNVAIVWQIQLQDVTNKKYGVTSLLDYVDCDLLSWHHAVL